MACPRRYRWAYDLLIRPVRDGTRLSIGQAYHSGIETLNKGGTLAEACALARSDRIMDEADRELTACMVTGWQWRWSESKTVRRVIASELTFEFEVCEGLNWAGKIDAIVELESGALAVNEYKTTGEDISAGSEYWRRLLIDRQISGYMLGARSLGYDVTKVLYDAARVPGLSPRLLSRRKDSDGARESMEQYAARVMASMYEKPDWYFARHEINRLDKELDETRRELAHFAGLIRSSVDTGTWPRNTDSCRRWGTCPYFGPCSLSHDPEADGLPAGFQKVETAHVELTIMESDHATSE